ncbi:non-heme iron oxygenase ferredoxin subunit [Paralimibaculum aggregatum]|uniref:Non-heme iron oxygenase ferredoxin subunit n=1 Tax=Paralimibaculum aggregatum TaxID=3036245 RepID=A0ABQ6LNN3_9RHOB|nr:non-heme iron oxygenase ferredoxin subunit [Limibaculum sp. NKW23]GMG84825.1 non-heme iron oxygenase ferredoxin subunit [Limibaculum sp. NKW23]
MTEENGQWHQVIDVNELDDGEMIGVEIGERRIAIYKVDGEFYATDNICTHAFAILSDGWLDGDVVECPLHGGCFNVCTGKALGDPVEVDLQTYELRVVDGILEVLCPKETAQEAGKTKCA